MGNKVVELETRPQKSKKSVLETLENVLEEAREGRVAEVAIAIVRPNGAANTAWSDMDNAAGLLGAITLCAHRLSKGLDE